MKWTRPEPVPFHHIAGRTPAPDEAPKIAPLGRWGGGRVHALLFADAATLYVATSAGVHVRDADTLKLRAHWLVDHGVAGLQRGPDGVWAMVRTNAGWSVHTLGADGALGPARWIHGPDKEPPVFALSKGGGFLAVAATDAIDVIDLATGERVQRTVINNEELKSLVISQDGATVVLSAKQLMSTKRSTDGVAIITRANDSFGRGAVLWLPDGRLARASRQVEILDPDTLKELESFKLPYFSECGAVSFDGTRAVFGSIFDKLYFCELPSLASTGMVSLAPWSNSGSRHEPPPIAVSDTLAAFVSGSDGRLYTLRLADHAQVASVPGYEARPTKGLAVDATATRILVTPSYEEPLLIDVATGLARAFEIDRSTRAYHQMVESAAVLPGGEEVLVVWGESLRSKQLLRLRVDTDELLAAIKTRTDAPDLALLGSAGWASTQRTSAMLGNGAHDLKLYAPGRKSAVTTLATTWPLGLSASDSGARLALHGVRILDLAGLKVTGDRAIDAGPTSAFALSADGTTLATAGNSATKTLAVRAWSEADGFQARLWELELGASAHHASLVWVGALVYVGLQDGRIVVIDPAVPAVVHRFEAHAGGVSALVRAAGLLWSVGGDGLVRAWGVPR